MTLDGKHDSTEPTPISSEAEEHSIEAMSLSFDSFLNSRHILLVVNVIGTAVITTVTADHQTR
jgi:hypothetical protein